MRIAWWTPTFWPHVGGMEVTSANLQTAMASRGFEFTVITEQKESSEPTRDAMGSVSIHRFPFHRALAARDLESMAKIKAAVRDLERDIGPAIVHLNSLGAESFFWLMSRETKSPPAVMSLHSKFDPVPKPGADSLAARVLQEVAWITGASSSILEEARTVAASITPRSSVIYYGADPIPKPTCSPPVDPPRLLGVGRLVPGKGFDLAIAALPDIVRAHPGVRLTIAGDGEARTALERQTAELGLNAHVHFVGRVSPERVTDLMDTSTLVLIPSNYEEGFGWVAIEAAQRGRPVVATGIGGLTEAVTDGSTGLLVARGDRQALAGAVNRLLGDPVEAAAMGRAGRARALEKFALARYVLETEDLYQKIGARGRDER